MIGCVPLDQRWRRSCLLGAAGLTALVWLSFAAPASATNPTKPVEIVTPEEVFERERIMPDTVQIRVREHEVQSLDARITLFRGGAQVLEQKLDLKLERIETPSDGEQPAGAVSLATIPAVPDSLLRQVEPGIYAHKVHVTAQIQQGVPPLEVAAWVRWRTDGKGVELLTIERYSALTEQVEATTGPDGGQALNFRGADIKLDQPGEPQRDRFDTRIGSDGVLPERPVKLRSQELQRSLDERDEN